MVPSVSDGRFVLLYAIIGFPERRRAGRAMLIEVFVEPEAENTTS